MRESGVYLYLILTLYGCGNLAKSTDQTNVPEIRWMDRKIYLAQSSLDFPQRNNEFQKTKLIDSIRDISSRSNLGSNYFEFEEVDESLLSPKIEASTDALEHKSFILIFPDDDFNDFVVNKVGGTVPDPNAVSFVNAAFKRKFFMIIRGSCFSAGSDCGGISGNLGLTALLARQFGLIVGLQIRDCGVAPESVMCSKKPNNSQWLPANRDAWVSSFNNQLESILQSPGFYNNNTPN